MTNDSSAPTPTWSQPWTVTLLCVLLTSLGSSAKGKDDLQADYDDRILSISCGDRRILRYCSVANLYKPYVEQFLTPGSVPVLRDGPDDHKHHHGLMFAIAVDGLNFWEEHLDSGKQLPRGAGNVKVDKQAGLSRAVFAQTIDWINPRNDKAYLHENRTLEVYAGEDINASLLTWRGRFTVPTGKSSATLTGSRYFGLGARFVRSMDENGHFLNSDGKTSVSGTNAVRSRWCAYTANADGKTVTFAMFDHPKNPRHPAIWYTMGDKPNEFAYLSNTLNLSREPLNVAANDPLVVCYGVALWDGPVAAQQIERQYRQWTAMPLDEPLPARQ